MKKTIIMLLIGITFPSKALSQIGAFKIAARSNVTNKESTKTITVDSLAITVDYLSKNRKDLVNSQISSFLETNKNKTLINPINEKEEDINTKIIAKINSEFDSKIKDLENKKKFVVNDTNLDYKKVIDSIGTLERKINKLKEGKEIALNSLGSKPCFFPTYKKTFRDDFFNNLFDTNGKTRYANAINLTGDSENASVQTELVSDNIGPFRIVFGNVLSNSSSDDQKKELIENVQTTFTNGGGNFYLDFSLPIFSNFYLKTRDNTVNYNAMLSIKGATFVKGFSNDLDTSTSNGNVGIYNYFEVPSNKNRFNFFAQLNTSYTVGPKVFYRDLGLTNEKPFFNGKLIAGVTLQNTLRISAIISQFGSDSGIRRERVSIGIQLMPSF